MLNVGGLLRYVQLFEEVVPGGAVGWPGFVSSRVDVAPTSLHWCHTDVFLAPALTTTRALASAAPKPAPCDVKGVVPVMRRFSCLFLSKKNKII